MRKLVATVTPHYKPVLTADDEVSLRHLRRFLGNYDRIIISPEGLAVNFPDFEVRRFRRADFSSIKSYNRLLLSKRFYQAFGDYEYILIYQMDSLVFSNKLKEWCEAGWSYIGAPWLETGRSKALPGDDFWAVGNGGFSLRNIPSSLKVFSSRRTMENPDTYWHRHYASLPLCRRLAARPKWFLKKLGLTNNIRWRLLRNASNEDHFWGREAVRFDPTFRVPPPHVALSFAFEPDPAFCFERNGRQLPFGCHAWAKYDRAFWEKYLL